jgi:hypothetical protein
MAPFRAGTKPAGNTLELPSMKSIFDMFRTPTLQSLSKTCG